MVCHVYLMCAVCDVTIWRHIHVSNPRLWRNLLTQYAYSSTRILLILCIIALNINYQHSLLKYRRKIHSLDGAWHCWAMSNTFFQGGEKCSGRASSLLRLFLLRDCEHRRWAVGLAGAHPLWQYRILLNHIRIESAHKYARITFVFLVRPMQKIQHTFSSPFSLLGHYQMPECFYSLTTAVFEFVNCSIMLQKLVM